MAGEVQLWFGDAANNFKGSISLVSTTANSNWNTYSATGTVPTGAVQAYIICTSNNGAGVCEFDDVYVVALPYSSAAGNNILPLNASNTPYVGQLGDPAGDCIQINGPGLMQVDSNQAYQIKRGIATGLFSQANGATANDGETIYFSSADGTPYLLDASGNPFTSFGAPPIVVVHPTPGTILAHSTLGTVLATSVTSKSFVLSSKSNGGTSYSAVTLTGSGPWSGSQTPAAATTAVKYSATLHTTSQYFYGRPMHTGAVTFTCTATPGGSTSFSVRWASTGQTYVGSTTLSVAIAANTAISISITATNYGGGDLTSMAPSCTLTLSGSASINGIDFDALILSPWSG